MSDQIAGTTPEQNSAVLGWYHELSTKERRTFWACFVGWALDAMDVQLYSLVIATLTGLWAISRGDAGCSRPQRCWLPRSVAGWSAFSLTVTAGCGCCRSPSCGFRFSP